MADKNRVDEAARGSNEPSAKGIAPIPSPASLTPQQLDEAFGTYRPEPPPRAQAVRDRDRRR